MNIKITLLTAACALALAACGDGAPPPADPAATPPAEAPATAPAQTPADMGDVAPAQAPADTGADAPAVASSGCAVEIDSNDAMQFSTRSITVPASCEDFTITLTHSGNMPVAAMGHNVVITTNEDMQAVAADGMAAGLDAGYVMPNDDRVIAQTDMIGGGETTSVTFSVSDLQGDYRFFCSFPGHSALMNGTLTVE